MINIKKILLKPSIIFLFALIVLVFLYNSFLKNLTLQTISPIQKRFYNIGSIIGEKLSPFFVKKDLIEENKELRSKLAKLYKENVDLKLRERDYQILKTQLEFLEEKDYQYILAQVIGKTPEPLSQTLIINRGSQDGLKEGLAVTIDDGILIGKLTKVDKNTSQVLLLLDHQSRVAALVQRSISQKDKISQSANSEALAPGIIKGQFDLSLIMDLIPLDKKITPDDPVITSGLEPDIPAGLLIGYVESVETSPNQLFQKAIVRPLANFEGLRIVTIILP